MCMPQDSSSVIRLMFVCLGNICRSPLAHGVFHALVDEAGLTQRFEVASSGMGAWHIGQRPDARMRRTARRHGVSLDALRAQQFEAFFLEEYDHIYVMDRNNLRDVLRLDSRNRYRSKVRLFREYDPDPGSLEVPDPYFHGSFDEVFDMIDRTARVLLKELVALHGLARTTL